MNKTLQLKQEIFALKLEINSHYIKLDHNSINSLIEKRNKLKNELRFLYLNEIREKKLIRIRKHLK